MLLEEGADPAPGVVGAGRFVAHAGHSQNRRKRADRELLKEAVAGVGILLDVVGDAPFRQGRLQLGGCPLEHPVPGTVAADHGAGAAQRGIEVLRQLTVVGSRDVEAPAGGHQSEPAAHAEPDDPDPARAVTAAQQPAARPFDVVAGLSLPAEQGPKGSLRAPQHPAACVEVRGHSQVPVRRVRRRARPLQLNGLRRGTPNRSRRAAKKGSSLPRWRRSQPPA